MIDGPTTGEATPNSRAERFSGSDPESTGMAWAVDSTHTVGPQARNKIASGADDPGSGADDQPDPEPTTSRSSNHAASQPMIDSRLDTVRRRLEVLVSSERLGLFASAGLIGTVVDNGVLFTLVEFAAVGFVPAKATAWVLAIATIFVINERLTFAAYGSSDARSVGWRLIRSYQVRFVGFLVTLTVFVALVYAGTWYIAANVVGIGIGFFVNYTFESLYTWQVHRGER